MARAKKNSPVLPDSPETAKENYDAHLASEPGEFLFDKQALLDMAEAAIAQRESFSYDPGADAMYRQYRDQYIRQGRQAMEDTIGVAASLNGGYGNSYALTAGQQAYRDQLGQLADIVPELYRLAYQKYTDQGQALQERYEALVSQKEAAQDAHQTAWDKWNGEKDDLYTLYRNALSQQNTLYERLYKLVLQGYSPTKEETAAAGMTPAIVMALREAWQRGEWIA